MDSRMLRRFFMRILFVEYPKCTTCQKAKKWLVDNKVLFDDRHIVDNNPNENELKDWIKKSDLEVRKWFNTTGMKYRELNLKEKLDGMSDEEKIKLLASDGMLVKRPVVVADNWACPGFKEKEWINNLK